MKQIFTWLLKICFFVFIGIYQLNAQTGTANGNYNFASISTSNNSHSSGFKTQQDKFAVNNGAATYPLATPYSGYQFSMYDAFNTTSSSTGNITIKAEGGSVCKTFTLKNINFYIYNSSNQSRSLKTMTMTIKDNSGTTIATHTLSGTFNTTNAQTLFSLTTLPFSTAFPSSGYSNVSEINFVYTCGNGIAGYSPSNLFFRSIDLENISAGLVATPTITTTGTLSAFSVCSGNSSTAQSFTVGGSDLTANLAVTAPAGYEISTNASGGYSSSLTLTPSSGTVTTTTIYVRLSSTATGTPGGNIACTSTGATTQNIAVNGLVNSATSSTYSQTSCDSFYWAAKNKWYYANNNTDTIKRVNAKGCDSIVTLNLTINLGSRDTYAFTSCDSFVLSGVTYYNSTVVVLNSTSINGCLNADTFYLTINKGTHNVDVHTACDSYVWHSRNYTSSITDTFSYTNGNGCVSVDTLKLTINTGTHNVDIQTACDSYIWNGRTYTSSTIDTFSYSNGSGCMSVDTLKLTIIKATAPTVTNDTLCFGGGIANLSANGTGTINWYNQITGGTLVNSAGTYSPNVTTNTTYYVDNTVNTPLPPYVPITMPSQTSTYSGGLARGYYFTAPTNFIITALQIPTTASSASQNIAVVKFTNATIPPVYPSTTNAFTTLFVTQNNTTSGNIAVNIPVAAGDLIGILGMRGGVASYSNTNNNVNIGGNTVALNRFAMQYNLSTTLPKDLTREATNTPISRVNFEYTTNYFSCTSSPRIPVSVTVLPASTSTFTVSACDSFYWSTKSKWYYVSNNTDTIKLVNAVGCDSVITLNLTINTSTHNVTTQTACESFTWNGTTYTTSGTYIRNYNNANGCASADTLYLTINTGTFSATTQAACDGYTWAANGQTYTTSGTYIRSYNNANGCASADTLYLTINTGTFSATTQAACNSYTWAANGQTYTTSGTYIRNYNNANGCASADTLYLTINTGTFAATTQSAIGSYTWAANGQTYTTSGTYINNYNNANGCASADTLYLTITPACVPTFSIFTTSACDTYTWVAKNNKVYTVSNNTDTIVLVNASGCDSVVTLNLTINTGTFNATTQTACNSYTWNGRTYTSSTVDTFSYTNSNGCASADTLYLTINTGTFAATTQASCNNYTWAANGQTYTTSGTYINNYNNANGCASADTLYLTINTGTFNVTTQTACNSYTWNGRTYTSSTVDTFSYTNSNGCVSVDTLYLTINTGTFTATTQASCNNYTWAANGQTYTTSGTYINNYNNANGCASADTLYLTINTGTFNATTQTACNSYTWNGRTYASSTVDTFSYTNSNGCASVDTLYLTINSSTHNVITTSSCDSFYWSNKDKWYYSSTIDTFGYINSNGCASVDTLKITVNNAPAAPSITTSTLNVTVPATGVTYSCTTVANAFTYFWSYTGTGATITNGQGTTTITVDFAANATNGSMQVIAVSSNGCNSKVDTVSIVLPISITNFTVSKVNNTALLNWSSTLEVNAKEYQVLRSTDGRTFEPIGIVAAKGVASEYKFTDMNLPLTANTIHYKLKLVDKDGKYSYSENRLIKLSNTQFVTVYPNPAHSTINIKIDKLIGIGSIVITDLYGKQLKQQPLSVGINTIDVSHLAKGMYMVTTITEQGKQTEKVFVE